MQGWLTGAECIRIYISICLCVRNNSGSNADLAIILLLNGGYSVSYNGNITCSKFYL